MAESTPVHFAHKRLRWKKPSAQGAVGATPQLQLPGDQVHTNLAAREQIELLVRLD
jgi:hypothetical protein